MSKPVPYKAQLPVVIIKEGEQFVAYCPILDLSTCGKTFKEAQRRFGEILDMFIEDLVERGTLDEVLISCGWQKTTGPKPRWIVPQVVGQVQHEAGIPVAA